jgi:putative RecB family exonuclease
MVATVTSSSLVDSPLVEEPIPLLGSLSPSRASDFKSCPLLYRFRTIDRLPEHPSPVAVRGTLVHSVLERLFDLPPAERTLLVAEALVAPEWARLAESDPEVARMFADSAALAPWLESARPLLAAYFSLEDPTRLAPAEREQLVEVLLPSGLRLRGFVDRLDVAPTGEIRVVDYKTGAAPREAFEGKALFQLKFYALIIWRTRGVVPRQLRLLYLGDCDMLTYSPDESELARFERTLEALWTAIARATDAREFRPRPSRLCDWCQHQSLCPSFGGTPPPLPDRAPDIEVPADVSPVADD